MMRIRWITSLIFLLALSGASLSILPLIGAWSAAIYITLAHILLAAMLVILTVPLLYHHMRKNGRWRFAGASGWGALVFLAVTIISGSALIVQGQRGRLALIHILAGFLLLVSMFAHRGIAHIRFLNHGYLRPLVVTLLVALVIGAMATARPARLTVLPEEKQFPPASMRILGELPDYDEATMGEQRCSACHKEIADQWKESMHAVADTELYYARVVGEFRKEYGFEASNWCAGCHSPLRLGRGQLNEKVASVAQPNVDCVVCHSIRGGREPLGNNNYDLLIARPGGYEIGKTQKISDRLLLMQPAAHRALWNGSFMHSPEFCASCHRQALPDSLTNGQGGLVLQDTYQEWAKSKYNTADKTLRRTCQDCHMPVEQGLAADLGNKRPSHLFLGGSIDIARINGAHSSLAEGKQFMQKAATLRAEPVARNADGIELSVKVTNSGAGHNLPTGVTDLRQMWIEITVANENGQVVFRSGHLDAGGFPDPSGATFGMTLGDGKGNPVHFHHITKAREILSDTSIPAGETREVKYIVPTLNSKRLRADVRLLYKSVPQGFINHYMTADLRSELVVMSQASATIEVSP